MKKEDTQQEVPSTRATLRQASQHFNKNQYEQALCLYNKIISSEGSTISPQDRLQAIRNRASYYASLQQYSKAIEDCKLYIKLGKENGIPIVPEVYVTYILALIKGKKIEEAIEVSNSAVEVFPYHKKIKQLAKQAKQIGMTNNEQTYVENMFEKLCSHPKIRQYLKEQSFLTKVQRLIRNPSLTATLEKMDPRIGQVADFMLMAEQD